MIDEHEKQSKKQNTELFIGSSRVNLSQRMVESAKFSGKGDYTEPLMYEVDYRKRVETLFSKVHLSDEDNADLSPEALMESYWSGQENVSKTFWAEWRDTGDIIWIRVDVRVVPRLDTGDLLALFNNWDVSRTKNMNRIMELIIGFDYDYVEYICARNGHYEIMAKESGSICPKRKGEDYDSDIAEYLRQVAVCEHLEEDIRRMQLPAIVEYLEQEPLYVQEVDVREHDGSVRRKMLRYAYMDYEMGTIVKSCTDIEDIVTEEKKKQEQLEQALEAAERANGAKSEFLAHMSHDIRTPMNAIIGMTAIAKEECKDEQILEYLDKIEDSGHFLLALINDILDISKIESGNMRLKLQAVHLEEIDMIVDTNIRPLMEQKNIHFRYEMRCGMTCIYGDLVRLKQVFFNILSNAAKYTPEGGEVWFTADCLRYEGDMEWVRFVVGDTGIGMSQEFLEHAFEPFVQESNRTFVRQSQGTGLGLSIVKKLVDLMKGEIQIKSVYGEGTEVIIDLPLAPADPKELDKKSVAEQEEKQLSGCRVLLVEDNEINTFVAKKILENQGVSVEHAQNGRAAVEMFEEKPESYYDAIIMDIRMPVMNGLEATETIRKMKRKDAGTIPIIAMSANAYDEDIKKSLEAGMNAHLAKPIEPAVFLETIKKCLK